MIECNHFGTNFVFRIVLTVLTILVFSVPAAFAQMDYPQGEFGNWPFPEVVDPLPSDMQPGRQFKDFPKYQRAIDWMAVPPWLAGDWRSTDYRTLKTYDHNTNLLYTIPRGSHSPMDDHFGDQQDRNGGVWNCNITPYVMNALINDQNGMQYIIAMKPLENNNDQLVLWQRIIHCIVDAQKIIQDSYTEERVTQFSESDSPGVVIAQANSRFYDGGHGKAYVTASSVRMMRCNHPFALMSQRFGVNLPASFYEFLQNTGRGDLVPVQQQ